MKHISTYRKTAFTLIELLVVIATILILTAQLLPSRGGPKWGRVGSCANNLRNVGINMFAWSNMHDSNLPYQISVTNGGSMELISGGSAVAHFKPLTNSGLSFPQSSTVFVRTNEKDVYAVRWATNYGLMKRSLVCPSDKRYDSIYSAPPSAEITDTNISYFVNVSASLQQPKLILAGDRHLQINDEPVKSGLLLITPKMSLGWSKELHDSFEKGNLLFADGHVELVKNPKSVLIPKSATNRLVIP